MWSVMRLLEERCRDLALYMQKKLQRKHITGIR